MKLTHRLSIKILAILMMVASVIFGGLSVVGLIVCADMRLYENPNGFYDSAFCSYAASGLAWHVETVYTNEGLEGIKQNLENYSEYGNAYIRLIDADTGDVLAKSDIPDALKNKKFLDQAYYRGADGYVEITEFDNTDQYEQTQAGVDYYWYAADAVPRFYVSIAVGSPLTSGDEFYDNYQHFKLLDDWKLAFPIVGVVCVLLCVLCLIYLFCAVGHKGETDEIFLNPVDKIPLDLLTAAYLSVWVIGVGFGDNFADWVMILIGICAGAVLGLSLLLTVVTRFKHGSILENTLIWRGMKWLYRWGGKVFRVLLRMGRAVPLIWKTVLILGGIALAECTILFGFGEFYFYDGFGMFLLILFNLALVLAVCFGVWQLRMLQKGGEALAAGNFEQKINTKRMYWDFRTHGEHLNSIGKGMLLAVDQRMKSERMKTELITNVSHDIKTPLTSIINYVDLLQRPNLTEEDRAEYLDTLARQAKRLKKLTEDLVEASKASTGNLSVSMVPTDVQELLGQAVAEYEEKFRAGRLEVVVRQEPLTVMADGRLLWRVLDNLLGNVSKYALAGTRVYLTAERVGERVVISVKNVSRAPLNISEEELMERFVRGDTARSTEGSGLGLNIARSLAQLQRGDLRVTIDGDLFKVEIELEPV